MKANGNLGKITMAGHNVPFDLRGQIKGECKLQRE